MRGTWKSLTSLEWVRRPISRKHSALSPVPLFCNSRPFSSALCSLRSSKRRTSCARSSIRRRLVNMSASSKKSRRRLCSGVRKKWTSRPRNAPPSKASCRTKSKKPKRGANLSKSNSVCALKTTSRSWLPSRNSLFPDWTSSTRRWCRRIRATSRRTPSRRVCPSQSWIRACIRESAGRPPNDKAQPICRREESDFHFEDYKDDKIDINS